MTGIGVYITVTITLLGVAYPILLQVIARLEEKYTSENIVSLFDKEYEGKFFRRTLIVSLILTVLWTLKLEPLFQIDGINYFINNSANILLATSSIVLVVAFFLYVRKILIYYTPSKFIQFLRNKHGKSKNELKYFEALSDILLLSIKEQQRNISSSLSDFFHSAFRTEREKFKGEPVVYPDLYYEVVYKSIEELAILKEKRNYALEYRTVGSIWLLGELHGQEISEKTYSWIWSNLLLAVQYQQDGMIIYHWETAHQFYSYSLPYIHEHYDYSSENFQVSNQDVVNKRISERERFIEFHYALGGLLVYKNRYDCLDRMFSHTNSQPPKYVLLPESMDEIFKFYFKIRDQYESKYTWISHLYPFPEQSGLSSDSVIKKWISSYMAILFLRQYSIYPYLMTMRPLDFPHIPRTQGEKKDWIDGLDFFRKLVSEHLANQDLLNKLNLSFITEQWCLENNKVFPIVFIDNLKTYLQEAYNNNALLLPISDEKVAQFESETRRIIEATMEKYQVIGNKGDIIGDSDKWYVNGQKMLQSKDAFSESPEVHHSNFDSFLASELSNDIREGIVSTFLFKKTKSYLLKPEDIFNSIDKLELSDQYILISFGINIQYYINQIKVPGLSPAKYKNLIIYSFNGSRILNSSLFIIKKSDLPFIKTKPISADIIMKYSLKKISDNLNLYCSVIDLNDTAPEIFEENKQDKNEDELRKSVLSSIIISTEIIWRKNIDLIQIIQYLEYDQKGSPNNINDVVPIVKKKPSR